MVIAKKEFFYSFTFYLLVTIIYFRGLLTQDGIISGQDWCYPPIPEYLNSILEFHRYTWSTFFSMFGWENGPLSDIFFTFTIQFPLSLIFPIEKIPDILILSVFTLSGVTWYYFGKYLRLSILSSYLLGLFTISSPPFFNFIIFGWVYSLIFIMCLPLMIIFYLEFLETGKFKYIILQSITFSFVLSEAQSPIWILIVYSSILLLRFNIKDTYRTILFIISFIFITILIHSMWIIPLFTTNNNNVASTSASNFDISIYSARISPLNYLRNFGSTYNLQYEISYTTLIPSAFSLVYPFLAFASLLFKDLKRKKLLLSFGLVFLFIFFLWYFRFYLSVMPFSNSVRHVSRFLLLSAIFFSLSFSIGVETVLNYLKAKHNVYRVYSFYLLLFLVYLCAAYPYLKGELYSNTSKIKGEGISVYNVDQRIRKWKIPDYYKKIEKNDLFSSQGTYKNLFLPTGSHACFDISKKAFSAQWVRPSAYTRNSWAGGADCAKLSSVCNLIMLHNKSQESSIKFAQRLLDNFYENNTHRYYALTNIKYLVFRKNIVGSHYNHFLIYPKEFSKNLRNIKSISLVNDNTNYSIYENEQIKPLIYGKNF